MLLLSCSGKKLSSCRPLSLAWRPGNEHASKEAEGRNQQHGKGALGHQLLIEQGQPKTMRPCKGDTTRFLSLEASLHICSALLPGGDLEKDLSPDAATLNSEALKNH